MGFQSRTGPRKKPTRSAVAVTAAVTLLVVALGVVALGADRPPGAPGAPPADQYIAAAALPPADPGPALGPDASTGRVTVDCGRNERGHRNTDNVVISPGLVGGAHHTHDYIGNTSTDARSTDASLAAAGTTCADGDRSAYYWPVLRRLDAPGADADAHGGGLHGNTGRILTPTEVRVEFLGNPVGKVVPQPAGLRAVTGDPVAATTTDADVRARWGCSGSPGRHTTLYPRCPDGERTTRTLEFPSCWNGLTPDSDNHRTHLVFPAAGGVCPPATFPVPRLRLTLAYDLPPGVPYAVDSFPEQKRHPKTDHALFITVMTDARRERIAQCLNEGAAC
ncbi:DUF1996 domain-containing protein [Streptomyces sp. NPDC093252]|uniref:DUF1996 domain-containing protein n=1 Tax=Streptomyces sp. NPDC093252 TaxID=3154980 RepID=UPI00343C9B3F